MKNKKTTKAKQTPEEKEYEIYAAIRDESDFLIKKYSDKTDIQSIHSAMISSICLDVCLNFDLDKTEFAEIVADLYQDEKNYVDEIESEIAAEEAAKETAKMNKKSAKMLKAEPVKEELN